MSRPHNKKPAQQFASRILGGRGRRHHRAAPKRRPILVQESVVVGGELDAGERLRRNFDEQQFLQMQLEEHERQEYKRVLDHHRGCKLCDAIKKQEEHRRRFEDAIQSRVQAEVKRQMERMRPRSPRRGRKESKAPVTSNGSSLCQVVEVEDQEGGKRVTRQLGVCFDPTSHRIQSATMMPKGRSAANF